MYLQLLSLNGLVRGGTLRARVLIREYLAAAEGISFPVISPFISIDWLAPNWPLEWKSHQIIPHSCFLNPL